jgi:hypothetical protein
MIAAKGHGAVRAQKRPRLSDGEIWQKLELFATPPWCTRALTNVIFPRYIKLLRPFPTMTIMEPCAGLGHMSRVLAETGALVRSTDIHRYPVGLPLDNLCDATSASDMRLMAYRYRPDLIITNPPFSRAVDMLPNFLREAEIGVCLLLRLQFFEGVRRWYEIFSGAAMPALVAVFSERVGMCEGGYDPDCDTATAYAWFIWLKDQSPLSIPRPKFIVPVVVLEPGLRDSLARPDDVELAFGVSGFVRPSVLKRERERQRRQAKRNQDLGGQADG